MKIKLFFILTLIVSIFSACSDKVVSDYDKVHDKIMNMDSYSCDAEVKYISNKNENQFTIKQYCKMTGEYRIETISPADVEGCIILFDGKMIWQYNKKINSKISINTPDKPERSEILLSSFVKNYIKSQDVAVESSNMGKAKCTILEAKIPGEHKFCADEKLWVDNETLKPVQLIIYDTDGKERIILTYNNFEFNPKLDENLFKIS